MSRVIKFRAWDSRLDTYADPEGYFLELADGSIWFNYDSGGNDSLHDQHDYLTLEQFTGLQDKNGKDIYEGDILKSGTRSVVVMYQNTQFTLFLDDKWCRHLSEDMEEIIGNIHEPLE